MIIQAADLLSKTPKPTEARIRAAMDGHLCRCGTYPRVIKAILRASHAMSASAENDGATGLTAEEIPAAEVAR